MKTQSVAKITSPLLMISTVFLILGIALAGIVYASQTTTTENIQNTAETTIEKNTSNNIKEKQLISSSEAERLAPNLSVHW